MVAIRLTESGRENIKLVVTLIQATTIVFSALWATYTFTLQSQLQNEAVKRELRKPYEDRKLALYLETARVVANLAAMPSSSQRETTEARFWELYGESWQRSSRLQMHTISTGRRLSKELEKYAMSCLEQTDVYPMATRSVRELCRYRTLLEKNWKRGWGQLRQLNGI